MTLSRIFAATVGLIFAFSFCVARAAPFEITPRAIDGAQQPQVSIAADGTVFVAFGTGNDVYLAISNDGGLHFEPPLKLGTLPNLALGMRRGPRVAAAGRFVTVTAMNHEDLFAFHSDDEGRTWSAPSRVNDTGSSAREGLHNLAAGPKGQLYLTWLDLRSGKMEIYGALSSDSGKTWGANERVYHSPDGHVCECCHPSAAFNAKGDLIVMWRNWLDGSRDLWTAERLAGKSEFGPATKQGEGTWKLSGCPMDGGATFALDDGSFATAWRRDKSVYLALTAGSERRIGEGTQPVALLAKGAVHIWWQQGSDLMHVTAASPATPTLVASGAKFASAAASPKDGSIVVAFERTIDQRKSIFAEVFR